MGSRGEARLPGINLSLLDAPGEGRIPGGGTNGCCQLFITHKFFEGK